MEARKYGPFPFSSITKRPAWKWPNGSKLALWVVPNIEIFHLNVAMPGDSQERPKGGDAIPAVRQWAQRDYGNRVGVWRMLNVMAKHGVRGTVALNAEVCLDMPEIIEACGAAGWELMGHGRTNTHRVNEIPPAEEREMVRSVFDIIEKSSGKRPVGWLGSGLQETWNTLDYLVENGCKYVADWVNDDQPYWMDLQGKPLMSVPYSFEVNDSAALWRNKQSMPEFERMIRDTFDVLYEEGEESGRVMCISLHPFVMGQAHRIGVLDRALEYIMSKPGVWAATGSEIAEAYATATGGAPAGWR
ncbi:peptidoglycan/xylan/chitin deacetylase (PgdA/CDA1 family) [Phyllobacterium trifolii]|uniref:Chitooligosaccharide deacetylase n=1 Tax=Phyllobacterium trifolii TaxID=300193 RepID=A0A839UF27_9HYPH|nr:polysaccharide deacetylase family protein [Phyllobacterium trifolii]MBB3148545.1 peptidoglycan/xylan/chitin deacetylase (PgdA/CDA1 family) [Phyllobacterium trifolii]